MSDWNIRQLASQAPFIIPEDSPADLPDGNAPVGSLRFDYILERVLLRGASGVDYVVPAAPPTGAIVIPVGTTAQRPAVPVTGMIRYNTTVPQFEIYNGSAWAAV